MFWSKSILIVFISPLSFYAAALHDDLNPTIFLHAMTKLAQGKAGKPANFMKKNGKYLNYSLAQKNKVKVAEVIPAAQGIYYCEAGKTFLMQAAHGGNVDFLIHLLNLDDGEELRPMPDIEARDVCGYSAYTYFGRALKFGRFGDADPQTIELISEALQTKPRKEQKEQPERIDLSEHTIEELEKIRFGLLVEIYNELAPLSGNRKAGAKIRSHLQKYRAA